MAFNYFSWLIIISILTNCICSESFSNDLHNVMLQNTLNDAFCYSFCKEKNQQMYDGKYCNCNTEAITTLVSETRTIKDPLIIPKLYCKEDKMASIKWETNEDYVYFLEYYEESHPHFTEATISGNFTFYNLTPETVYEIRLWQVSYLKKQVAFGELIKFKTFPEKFIPSPVVNIYTKNINLTGNTFGVLLEWEPNADISCYFNILWITEDGVKEAETDYHSDLHEVKLDNLEFGTNYTITIYAKTSEENESLKKEYYLTTPSCVDVYHNLVQCRPITPENFTVTEELDYTTTSEKDLPYSIHINWGKPLLIPDYYEIQFMNINEFHGLSIVKSLNISGNETSVTLKKMILDLHYQISLSACSVAGCSDKIIVDRHRSNTVFPSNNFQSISQIIIILIILLVLILIILALGINRYMSNQKRIEQRNKYFIELNEKSPAERSNVCDQNFFHVPNSDKWEIDIKTLLFQDVLGEGAFGIVRKGYFQMEGGKMEKVAVKMLKERPTTEEIRQFMQEIDIMKSVKPHPYIVSLLGCITQCRTEGPLLVVEYCARGDLQTYLRNAWEKFCNMQKEIAYIEETSPNYFANKLYDFCNINLGDDFKIQPKHLLSIARQVSLGMEHLAKTRVVHRDLAARNVLVCENHTVKVSDFGLSRDIYQDNIYCKHGGGKLPVRWMALESLTHQRYTTQSDVWSFGILLWEIVTLGGTPYGGVHSYDLIDLLKTGYRLKCPATCSPELYEIMKKCWKATPKDRPTFTEISKLLEELLENVSQYLHLENIDVTVNDAPKLKSNEIITTLSYERYVKPIAKQN